MSVDLYDNSLLQKLNYWTENTEIAVYNVDESNRLIQVIADKTDDKSIKLPIIAIRRSNGFTINNPNKKPMSFDGLTINTKLNAEYDSLVNDFKLGKISREEYSKKLDEIYSSDEYGKLPTLNAVPITLSYNLDVYTRYQRENDALIRNLIFNIINYPTIQVKFNYEQIPIEHNSNLILGPNVETSFPVIKLFPDQICKQTLSISLEDAYLWDVRIRSAVSIDALDSCLEIHDKQSNDVIIEYIDPIKVI